VASERRPLANHSRELRQTLLDAPLPSHGARLSPNIPRPRAIRTEAESLGFLQTLLEMPIAAEYQRRGPIALHSVEPQRYSNLHRSRNPTWFDSLLQRSSQVLLVGSVLVLGYWFVNVPLSNWLHSQRAPTVRASGIMPSAAAVQVAPKRIAPTQIPAQVAKAAPAFGRAMHQNDIKGSQPRAWAIPITASVALAAAAPATQPITVSQEIDSPVPSVTVMPTAVPTETAAPLNIAPTAALLWPTITPVQLGTVSKPSPVPVQRAPVVAQPAAPARPNAASALPTRLIIPTLGLDVPIKEVFIVGGEWQVAEYAAGYLNGSGLPGVPGNLALSGHSGLYGAVFAHLGALNPGDDIYVDAAGMRYHYRLRIASAVWPNQANLLDSTETPTMTLITCTNWDTQRLVAQADFVDSGPALGG
jgi:LPXTG-site transpeptidase (sortase) family protein